METNHEITKDIIGVIEICTAFIAAVLGIAYPILLQVIQYFGNRYDSTRIITLFKSELEYKFFRISLFFTLIFVLLWIFVKYYIGGSTIYIIDLERFAIWMLLISTSLLVYVFLKLINKITIYLNVKELTAHIRDRDDKI